MYVNRGLGLLCTMVLLSACDQSEKRPLSFNTLLENPEPDGFSVANQVVPIEFPRDHGEHRDFQTEWWYLVGIVRDEEERAFGFQFTLFRQGIKPDDNHSNTWRTGQIYMAHMAISDIREKRHTSFERMSRGHKKLAHVTSSPFSVMLEDWSLRSVGDSFTPLVLQARDGDFGLNLLLDVTTQPVLHGDKGLSWKSPKNASYYFSIPRIQATGTVKTSESEFTVQGLAWMDREWSTGIFDSNYQGWNWLTLHLHDGRDLVLFNLVPRNEKIRIMPVGMLIDKRGQTQSLHPDEWQFTPIRSWRDWPVDWRLDFEDREILIEAAFDDQLMTTTVKYWEGVVFANVNEDVIGEGYLELTGY